MRKEGVYVEDGGGRLKNEGRVGEVRSGIRETGVMVNDASMQVSGGGRTQGQRTAQQ